MPRPSRHNQHAHSAAKRVLECEVLERSMPDVVMAFEGGAGTADTVRRALRAEIEIIEVEPVRGAA